jgi:hypothetical protein
MLHGQSGKLIEVQTSVPIIWHIGLQLDSVPAAFPPHPYPINLLFLLLVTMILRTIVPCFLLLVVITPLPLGNGFMFVKKVLRIKDF